MKQYCLKIASKNEKSLKNFLTFFSNHSKNKFNILQQVNTTHNTKKVITLLKSPHVNKTAQEQFEMRVFTKQILIKSFYLEKKLIFLKKFLNRLFQDISISLEYVMNEDINFENKVLIFSPDNFKLFINKIYKINLKRNKQKDKSKTISLKKNFLFKLTKFLNITSVFGEIITINHLFTSKT